MEDEWPYVATIIGDLTDPIDAEKAYAAWEQLAAYMEAARYQFQRKQEITDAVRAEHRAHPHQMDMEIALDGIRRRRQVFIDVHFYLDCFVMVQKMMQILVEATRFRRCCAVYQKWASQLDNYAQARHHLQHIDERFPGGRHARALHPGVIKKDSTTPHVQILEVFPDDKLIFGTSGESWDVGPKSIEMLEIAVAEFSQALAEDAREWYVNERPYQTQRGLYAVTPRPAHDRRRARRRAD